METVLVTGAAGFIGGHVLRHLSGDPGLAVLAATRDGRHGSRRLDLCDTGGMGAALEGVTAVVHCAVGGRAVTVDGTAALLRTAVAAGVRRVVHLSSVAVYGPATGVVREDAAFTAGGSGYAAWKVAAERACLAATGVETVRLRPAIVYGPGGTLWVSQMARRIRSGRWGVFGSAGDGLCNLVHVSDVAAVVAAALRTPAAAGAAFNVNGPEAITWNAWFERLAAAIGAGSLPTVSPLALRARSVAALPLKALARLRPGLAADWLLGAPAASERTLFALPARYPTDAARRVMGWSPAVGIDEGLAQSVAWLREVGLA